jgi:Family of unknown function (DUF6174)
MVTMLRRRRAVPATLFLAWTALAGCAGGEAVTPGSIRAARQRWERAGLRDYDLEWRSTGIGKAHYYVAVRGGQVRSIESILPDGKRVEVRSHEPKYFGVEGLFLTLAEELAQLRQARPFGQPRGTKVVMRFTPDAELGYPRSYHRDVLGTPQTLAIDVIRLIPHPAPVPAPPTASLD